MAHSPLPWTIVEDLCDVLDTEGHYIIDGLDSGVGEDDTRLIVLAVNVHADLLAACKALIAADGPTGLSFTAAQAALRLAREAVAKAEGREG